MECLECGNNTEAEVDLKLGQSFSQEFRCRANRRKPASFRADPECCLEVSFHGYIKDVFLQKHDRTRKDKCFKGLSRDILKIHPLIIEIHGGIML